MTDEKSTVARARRRVVARVLLGIALAIVMCLVQYAVTAPFGVGGFVFVLVLVESIAVSAGALIGVGCGAAVEHSLSVRGNQDSVRARAYGPLVAAVVLMAMYLLVTFGYPAPIVYEILAVAVVGGIGMFVLMWRTSPLIASRRGR